METIIVLVVIIGILYGIVKVIGSVINVLFVEPTKQQDRLREIEEKKNKFEEQKEKNRELLVDKEREWEISIKPHNEKYFSLEHEIPEMLKEQFLVTPCSSCNEDQMTFESISPTGKSITYTCDHCNKKMRVSSINKDSGLVVNSINEFEELVSKLWALQSNYEKQLYDLMDYGYLYDPVENPVCVNSMKDYIYKIVNASSTIHTMKWLDKANWDKIKFKTPEAIMSYEQTTREVIPENIRSQVWRRDLGKCVTCGSKQNLQFDHIIPVSKGGATSALNLQLLCRSCNQKKGARI